MKGNDNLKKYLKRTEGISSRRVLMTALMALAVLVIGAVLVAGVCLKEQALTTDFNQEKYSTLYTISFWNRLDGPGYVCAYPYRFVLKYTHWPDYICLQLPDRSGNGTCLCGRRKMGRQPDQWFY